MTNEDYKWRYEYLANKVRRMLEVQKMYYKSKKDIQLLKLAKALEKEITEIINPEQKQQQAYLDFLAR